MQKDLGNYRKSYEKKALLESEVGDNPLALFQQWFHEVEASESADEPNAMSLSTIGLDGYPKTRVVLLKRFTHEGFVFYSNYKSEKGKALEANPEVCLSFFWPVLERQVIIKGKAERLAQNLSEGYFESRPRGSQLGAWASDQSQAVASREYLEERLKHFESEYEGKEVPKPPHWGGYLVRPVSLEFWQGRPNRLHDRIRFVLQENFNWAIDRLAP
jgi:pyridoxamine 5'-phosphate oxidase